MREPAYWRTEQIYDLLLLEQKQDFVVSARVPLQLCFRMFLHENRSENMRAIFR